MILFDEPSFSRLIKLLKNERERFGGFIKLLAFGELLVGLKRLFQLGALSDIFSVTTNILTESFFGSASNRHSFD